MSRCQGRCESRALASCQSLACRLPLLCPAVPPCSPAALPYPGPLLSRCSALPCRPALRLSRPALSCHPALPLFCPALPALPPASTSTALPCPATLISPSMPLCPPTVLPCPALLAPSTSTLLLACPVLSRCSALPCRDASTTTHQGLQAMNWRVGMEGGSQLSVSVWLLPTCCKQRAVQGWWLHRPWEGVVDCSGSQAYPHTLTTIQQESRTPATSHQVNPLFIRRRTQISIHRLKKVHDQTVFGSR